MNRPLRKIHALPCLLALWLLPAGALADTEHAPASNDYAEELQGYVPGASRIEGRIRAPCCWNQTLDIHGSETANQLKREIRRRLRAGETPDAIEASIVARYGEKVLATPPGNPIKTVGILLTLAMAGAGVGAFFMLRRWKEHGNDKQPAATKDAATTREAPSEYDARLDAELKALDE